MTKIRIPYDEYFQEIELEASRIRAVLTPRTHEYSQVLSQAEVVEKALDNPIASPALEELAKDADRILVITSDHTRPVPSKISLPPVLRRIREANPSADVRILVATGFHRPTTHEELLFKFGGDLVEKENIVIHDSRDMANMVFKGILPSGGELWLNSLVDWAELVISEGFIEPHFFAGFSGGRKSILPGIASEKTVFANHCAKFIASGAARTGNLEDNPIHRDMLFAAQAAKLRFILNLALDGSKKIINAFAGHPEKAHEEGCRFVLSLTKVDAVPADIAITSNSGYPLDQNIYQAVKGMTAAEACVREGGVIIIAAGCRDGHGGEAFYRWLKESGTPAELYDRIGGIGSGDTVADQWEAQILARVLMKCTVIVVTDLCPPQIIKDMHMLHAPTLEKALSMAEEAAGPEAGIVVIPDGVGVIVGAPASKLQEQSRHQG